MKTYADCIWINGKIYTVDKDFSLAEAIAVKDGKILYVGNTVSAKDLAGENTAVIDLEGKTVVPGFIDSHVHLQQYGESLEKLPIRDKSKEEILAMVKESVKTLKKGEWLIGGMGFNNEVWSDPSYPTKEDLDAVAPHNPVFLPRMDGHLIWVNSCAFKAAGIDDNVKDPEGGEFMRNPDGTLLGCATNAASNMIRDKIPRPDAKARKQSLKTAQQKLLSYGVTSIADMSTEMNNVADLKSLYESGEYKLRFYGALREPFESGNDSAIKAYLDTCPEIGLYDNKYTVRAVKFLGDGAVGAQSAALYEDYSDRPNHRGTKMHENEELYESIKYAHSKGLQVIIHAIGDATIDQVLDTYEKVLSENPNPDHRFRIEHFQLVTGNSRQRAKSLGVLASMQPTHAPNSASMALRRLGENRSKRAYAFGLVLEILGQVAGGSDAPVAPPNPLDGIHSAVTRTNSMLEPKGGFCMENAVSPEDALKAYTIWGAYAQFSEDLKGSLEPGKLADFTVLDKDILKAEPHDILNIKVLHTIIGGNIEYSAL